MVDIKDKVSIRNPGWFMGAEISADKPYANVDLEYEYEFTGVVAGNGETIVDSGTRTLTGIDLVELEGPGGSYYGYNDGFHADKYGGTSLSTFNYSFKIVKAVCLDAQLTDKQSNRYGLNISIFPCFADSPGLDSVQEEPLMKIDFANISDIDIGGDRAWATGGRDHANKIGFNNPIGGTFKLSTQIMTMELLNLMAGSSPEDEAIADGGAEELSFEYPYPGSVPPGFIQFDSNADTWEGILLFDSNVSIPYESIQDAQFTVKYFNAGNLGTETGYGTVEGNDNYWILKHESSQVKDNIVAVCINVPGTYTIGGLEYDFPSGLYFGTYDRSCFFYVGFDAIISNSLDEGCGPVVFKNGASASSPKFYTITADTVWQDATGHIHAEVIQFHKACPKRALNISYSGDGDPTSVDIEFDLMQNANGDVLTVTRV